MGTDVTRLQAGRTVAAAVGLTERRESRRQLRADGPIGENKRYAQDVSVLLPWPS